jgi:putative transposase
VILDVFLQEHTKEEPAPMALSQSVLSDLLDAFRAGEGVELILDAVQLVLQELIERADQAGVASRQQRDGRAIRAAAVTITPCGTARR